MQVFKSYFKILKKHIGQVLIYIVIFTALLTGFVLPNVTSGTKEYASGKCDFAWFDEDQTEASSALKAYLIEQHTLVEIADDTKETMQDELYIRNVDVVVRVHDGYEEALASDDVEDYLEIVTIPGRTKAMLFESNVERYMSYLDVYLGSGSSLTEALEKTTATLTVQSEVTIRSDGNASYSKQYFCLIYFAWVFVAMTIVGICPILSAYNRRILRERIAGSSYRYTSLNKELLLATMVTGLGICAIFILYTIVIFRGEMLGTIGFMNILNIICYMLVALSIAYLVSRLTDKEEGFSMLGNVISLAMGFLCGIFVPIEYLGEGVIAVAHFLPAYWYVRAVAVLDRASSVPSEAFCYMGVQLLFAAAIVIAGTLIDRIKLARIAET